MPDVTVIGAGLAGSEAAWQLAERGYAVQLWEMRPKETTPAHQTDAFGELVCSNSLRALSLDNAAGLLKEELRRCGSLVMQAADATAIPAGGALAVDREAFSRYITERLKAHPNINIVTEEVRAVPREGLVIVASGPLTSSALSEDIGELTGEDTFYFYDAAAPIVLTESIDMAEAFWQSRYDKGETADYLNCPMDEATYRAFYQALMAAEWAPTKDFEKEIFFEGCMPVEVMGARGYQTLLFGPMKPVGLTDPRTGETPYAVLQLRKDDEEGRLMNIVGFQTRMLWPEQRKVLAMVPALRNAEIVRYGVMHRNSFMNAPRLLSATGQLNSRDTLFFAGQMTGVEGYIESTASGLVAGRNAACLLAEKAPRILPETTAIGALMHYITHANPRYFQPMNINFGLMPSLPNKIRNKKERSQKMAERALQDLDVFMKAGWC